MKRVSVAVRALGGRGRNGITLRRAVAITTRSRVSVSTTQAGLLGRYYRYEFRRRFGGFVAVRAASACLTAAAPRHPIACP